MNMLNKNVVINLLLIVFLPSIFITNQPVNADGIAIFSIAKDIIQGYSISTWHIPVPPIFFPDITFFLIFNSIFNDVRLIHILAAIFFYTLFLFSLYLFVKDGDEKNIFFRVNIISILMIVLTTFFLKEKNLLYYLIQPIFIPGQHGSAAILSFIFYYFFYKKNTKEANNRFLIVYPFSLITFFTDIFFVIYLGILLFSSLIIYRSKNFFLDFIFILVIAFLVTYQNILFSDNITSHINTSLSNIFSFNFETKYLLAIFFINLFSTIIFFQANLNQLKVYKVFLLTQIILSILFICSATLNNIYIFRYLVLFFLINIIFIYELQKKYKIFDSLLSKSYLFFLFLIFSFLINFYPNNKNYDYQKELNCIDSYKIKESNLIAEYWSAKIIFEENQRKNNLLQIDSSLNRYYWLINSSWEYIYPQNLFSYLITRNLNSSLIDHKLSQLDFKERMCDGIIIKIKSEELNKLIN